MHPNGKIKPLKIDILLAESKKNVIFTVQMAELNKSTHAEVLFKDNQLKIQYIISPVKAILTYKNKTPKIINKFVIV
jgi:hypothetical protein